MGRGLDLILSKIRAQPSPILASRYLSLVTELEDEEEKLARTLDLAEVLVTMRPKEALRLALLAHRAHRSDIRPLDLMIRVMEAAGKSDRVLVLKGEKSRLEAAQEAVRSQRQTRKPEVLPIEPKTQSMGFMAPSSGSESRILEAFLEESNGLEGALPWDQPLEKHSQKLVQNPPPKATSAPLSQSAKSPSPSPSPTLTPAPAPAATPAPTLTPAPAPAPATPIPSQKLQPNPQEGVLPSKPARPEHTQLSSRIVKGLQGKKPSDTILGIRAHSEPPLGPAKGLPSLDSEAEVSFVMDLDDRPPQGGGQGSAPEAPFLSQARTSVSLPALGRPHLPWGGVEKRPEPLLEKPFVEPSDAQPEVVSPQQQGETEMSQPYGKTQIPTSRSTVAPSSHQDLLVELGRIASRGVIEPTYAAHGARGGAQPLKHQNPLGKIQVGDWSQAPLSGEGSSLGNHSGGLGELLSCIAPGQSWSVVAWDLFQALWGENPDENTRSLLEASQLSRQTPGFWGYYLDTLCKTGGYRRALWEVRMTLHLNPTLPWVEVAAKRLPQIWSGLGVRGFQWKPEEGVDVLLNKLSRSPTPLMPALVGILVEDVDHHKEASNR